MKKLNALIMLSFGVLASSSGMIQAQAALYTFSVDFSTKEVANFNDFNQTYNSNTYDLGATMTWNWSGSYSFNSCPTTYTVDIQYRSSWRLNATGSFIDETNIELPNFICSTSLTLYSVERTIPVSDTFISGLINDDANFININTHLVIRGSSAYTGLELRLHNYTTFITLNYNFDTTYLFNYFLSDTQALSDIRGGTWSVGSDLTTKIDYVYTTAGNDEYRIVNTNIGSIGTTRKKYAVDYNSEFFRGTSIGARIRHAYNTLSPYTYDAVILPTTGVSAQIRNQWNYYYLNAANAAQAIVNVPQISFTSQSCSGGFLDINVGCFFNNAMAWLTNDAPIISDLTTIVNTGIEFAGQTFGVIGNFTTSNMFGYLILGGFGFIAVKWLFKDDK
jgi:hypothetical protein